MKKLITMILALAMVFALCPCGPHLPRTADSAAAPAQDAAAADTAADDAAEADTAEGGELILGTSADYAPLSSCIR